MTYICGIQSIISFSLRIQCKLELGRYIGKYIVSYREMKYRFFFDIKIVSAALKNIGRIRYKSCLKVAITLKNSRTLEIFPSLRFPKLSWVHYKDTRMKFNYLFFGPITKLIYFFKLSLNIFHQTNPNC